MLTDLLGAGAVLTVAVLTKDLPVDASAAIAIAVLLVYTLTRAVIFWKASSTPPLTQYAPARPFEHTPDGRIPIETPEYRPSPVETTPEPEITIRATPPQYNSDLKVEHERRRAVQVNHSAFYVGLAMLFMAMSFAMISIAMEDPTSSLLASNGALAICCSCSAADTPGLSHLKEGASALVFCPQCPVPDVK
jgi:hypothetical protein